MLVCAYALFNVRLLLLSGIGKPYDPASGEGVVGRNYAYQTGSGSTAFFEDAKFNPFAAAGSLGVAADDYNSDNFDHGPHGPLLAAPPLLRGSYQRAPDSISPDAAGTPNWGSQWKKAVRDTYQRVSPASAPCGSVMGYRNNYLDLDPDLTRTRSGRPLMRMTFDYQDNERKMAN